MMNILLCVYALVAFASSSADGSTIVTGAVPSVNASSEILPIRQNIENLQNTGPVWDLYILALRQFADGNETDPLSYYQISGNYSLSLDILLLDYLTVLGIHGIPFQSWDEAFGDNNLGYCTHNSILFGPWHRVYLALFEQVLSSIAQEIATTYPPGQRVTYEAAARALRIPYWDWANSSVLPNIATIPQINIQGPSGSQTIQNPLYSYEFRSSTDFSSRFFVCLRVPYNQSN